MVSSSVHQNEVGNPLSVHDWGDQGVPSHYNAGKASSPAAWRASQQNVTIADRSKWSENMSYSPVPHSGCFEATYPSTVWQGRQCVTAPLLPLLPSTVGNGNDYVAKSPGTLIGSSFGSFQSIYGLTSETDSKYGANYYTLQDNTNFFTTSTTYTGSKSTTGWEQFVYSSTGYIFIQYWLIGYQSAYGSCPSTGPPSGSSWMTYSGSCYANSPGYSVPSETALNLANLALKGYANFANSNDEVVLCISGGSCYAVAITDQVVNLYQHWQYAEFNVVGYGSGSQANFNPGTTITVVNTLKDQNGNVIVPSCVNTGYTGETNNLNLGSCSSNSNGQIVFIENSGTLDVVLVSPPSPPNGGTVSSSPVTFEAQVGNPNTGSAVQGASVLIWLDGSNVCSGSSDSSGYYSCSYSPSQGGHSWYAAASAIGYNPDISPTWSFTYSPPNQKPWASIISPSGWLHGTVTLTATAGDPDGYVVRVRFLWTPDKANGPYWIIGDDTNGANGWSITWDCGGLSNNDPSVWVAAVALDNSGLESDWSWSNQFGVDQTPPSTPSLSSPSNGLGTTNPTPTFAWNSASDSLSGVASYAFQIDTSTSFNSGNLRIVTEITSTSYAPGTPLASGTWYWRVGAVDNAGNQGSFSSYWSVTIQTLVTTTVTLTQTSTSYSYRTTTMTSTSYTSTSTLTSTIPTVTTVVLVPLTITSTEQSTQFLTPVVTTTTTSYTSTTTLTSTIPTTIALVQSTVTSIVQSIQYLTSILSTTTTSYTGTETSTSTVVVPTTVVLVPLSVTSTVQSTQSLSSTVTTTMTSYTSTVTLTSTIPTVTTVVLLPTTTTSTVQSTQFLTSTLTTTTTSYTATVTSTSTSVVYTTVTVSEGAAGGAGSIPLTYFSFLSLLAITVGHKVVTSRPKKIPKVRSAILPGSGNLGRG